MKDRRQPPQWIDRMLRIVLHEDCKEEIIGDLHERFAYRNRSTSSYFIDVLSFLRFKNMRIGNSEKLLLIELFMNHLVVSYRNIRRGGAFSIINISGLALGLLSFICISSWVRHERSIDGFHENDRNLYTLYYHLESEADEVQTSYKIFFGLTSPDWNIKTVLANELKGEVPGIKHATPFRLSYDRPWGNPKTLKVGDKKVKFEGACAGEDFFKMFSYRIIAGDETDPLKSASSIAISEKAANILFDSPEGAIGQSIRYENERDFIVTRVFEDVGIKSSLKFDFVLNWQATQTGNYSRSTNNWNTFIELDDRSNAADVEALLRDHLKERTAHIEGIEVELGLFPFSQTYLHADFENGKPAGGRIDFLRIFKVVGIFILLVAGINFVNLSVARSMKRAKEIGIRKVVGSSRLSLLMQILLESVLLTACALFIALTVAHFVIPYIGGILQKPLILFADLQVLKEALIATVLLGLLAGIYPALVISSFKPIKVLKKTVEFKSSSKWIQTSLVVLQFVISMLMLIGTIVVSQQTSFLQSATTAYQKEQIIYLHIEGKLNDRYQLFKERLSTMPGIKRVDRTSEVPHAMDFETGAVDWQGRTKDQDVWFYPSSVGFDFLDMMSLKVVEGRGFSKDIISDTAAFIVNQTAIDQMMMEEPIGKWISAWDKKGRIIGVLEDYHINSLHQPIRPLILDIKEDLNFGKILVQTLPGQTKEAISSIENLSAEMNPDYPFDIQFMDQEYAKLYDQEIVIRKLSNLFAVLGIIISSFGLLGLAVFTAERRTKELGIRKVLGASILHLLNEFSISFLRLVGIAALISIPLSWWLLSDWLNGFAYRVDLQWWVFAMVGLMTGVIAVVTVSLSAYKTTSKNPVEVLRSE